MDPLHRYSVRIIKQVESAWSRYLRRRRARCRRIEIQLEFPWLPKR